MVGCAALLGACGVQEGGVEVDELPDLAEETSLTPRSFALQVTGEGLTRTELVVEGQVADDHRYHGRVTYEPGGGYEELVVDDRRWVRMTGGEVASRFTEQARESCPEDEEALAALAAGEWIEDADGAAGEFEAVDGLEPLSPAMVLGVVRAMDLLPEALRAAAKVREWNPQAVDYFEAEDKFERHEDDGLRFDALPPEYDPDRVFRDGIPSPGTLAEHFTYTSVWVDGGVVTRVETLVDIDRERLRADVERVRRLQSEQTGRPLDELPEPPLPQQMRQTLTIEPARPALPGAPEDAPLIALSCLGSGIPTSSSTEAAAPEELVGGEVGS